jgi:hypothetical protein
VRDAYIGKEGMELMVPPPPLISLDSFNLLFQGMVNFGLELMKHIENIRFMFEKVDPGKSTISIDKAHIIFFTMHS